MVKHFGGLIFKTLTHSNLLAPHLMIPLLLPLLSPYHCCRLTPANSHKISFIGCIITVSAEKVFPLSDVIDRIDHLDFFIPSSDLMAFP